MFRTIRVLCCFCAFGSIGVACTRPNPQFSGDEADGARRDLQAAPDGVQNDARHLDAATGFDLQPSIDRGAPRPDAPPPDRPSPDLSLDLPSPCGPGETHFGVHCYRATSGLPLTYSMARNHCLKSGALPASISCAAEQAFVYSLVSPASQGAWIGLVRTGYGKSDFAWESGDALGYTHWAPGEPNNAGYHEDCVLIWGPAISNPQLPGKWNDAACDTLRDTVVCERKP